MAPQSSIFPIFLRAEYRDGTAIQRFQSDAQRAAQAASGEIKKVGAALDGIFAKRGAGGSLDLGVAGLRLAIAEQRQLAAVSREVADAAIAAAKGTGSFDAALTRTAKAAAGNAAAQKAELAVLEQRLPLLERVQAELNKGVRAAEAQLKAERDLDNFRKSSTVNQLGIRAGRREATIDRAALSGTTLDQVLGRVNRQSPEVSRELSEQRAAQDQLTQSAARLMAQIDPLVSAQQRFDVQLAEANRLLQAGVITTEQYAQAQGFAATQLQQVEAQVSGAAAAEARRAQELKETEAAQRGLAASAAQLRSELDPMFAAQQRFDQELARAEALFAAGSISAREYAQAQELARQNLNRAAQEAVGAASATDRLSRAQRDGTTARSNVINSVRSERTAFIQLGQQLQDVSIQAQMGTDAFLIFGQQVPQAAFALSGLSDSSNETLSKVGEFATFLSGPWGAALFAATAFIGPLVYEMLGFGDAADDARIKSFNFADGLDVLSLSAENATAAMDQLGSSLERAIALQGDFLRRDVQIAQRQAENLQAQIKADEDEVARRRKAERSFSFLPEGLLPSSPKNIANVLETNRIEDRLNRNRALLPQALELAATASIAQASRAVEEAADPILGKINQVDEAIGQLNERRRQTVLNTDTLGGGDFLSQADYERQLGDLSRERAALEAERRESRRNPRSRRGPRARVNREPEQLDRFAEQTAERVSRINDRFAEQTRLVTQSLQANRELDSIIAETNRKMTTAKSLTADQRKEFEGIIKAAEATRDTIDAALVRPFEDLRRESDERLQIETLLAQGRSDEAAALQAVLQLQRQIGTEAELRAALEQAIAAENTTQADRIRGVLADYQERMEDVRETVIAEQQLSRELRVQAELLEAQADVARTVASDLRSLLSGRKVDFVGNFKQALLDLQGARLFEDLFGPAFRQIEEELRGNTPQGRANARFTAEVEKAASTTTKVEQSLDRLAGAIDDAADRIAGRAAAANDNSSAVASEMWDAVTGGGIVVTGSRSTEVDVSRMSAKEIADRISKATVDGFLGPLEDLLGPQFTAQLGGVLTKALSGYVRGGEVGAVLGGFEGISDELFGKDSKISGILGKAGEGAAAGTQVDGIIKALGIRGSKTGAQIGGAIGSVIPIPGAAQAGAAIGSIIGGLIKGTPRGSATIGGAGGSLGITGVVGNRGSLKEVATGLAGSVLETVNDIARQLGAGVNAASGLVSIGQRKGAIRVDPRGGGATKIGNGAVDFGEDAEAAVAFAVQNLIQDGVITGLKASENRLIQAGKDIQAAIADVLTFRSVFDRLREIKDPLGFQIDKLNEEFTGLIDLFKRAGASTEEFASLEELYNLERARAIEEATDRVVGSLKQLLNDLTVGDSGLSLRDRRANALTEFDGLAARVQAGDSTAFDDFADVSKQLLDIERQLFGSTQSYFDRLAQVTALTQEAIADQTNVTSIAGTQPSPFEDRVEINRSIDIMNSEVTGWLKAINDNLIALDPSQRTGSGGGGSFESLRNIVPVNVSNF